MAIIDIPLMYKPEHFELYELVYPEIYDQYAKQNRLHLVWGVLDRAALWTIDQLRKKYGPCSINTWYQKTDKGYTIRKGSGVFSESGLRPDGTNTGSVLSQHKFGRAFDLKFRNIAAPDVVKDMDSMGLFRSGGWRSDPDPKFHPFRYLTTIERSLGGVPCSWLHIDTRLYTTGNGAIVALDI